MHFTKCAVIVGGLALDYCVKTTARQLRQAGFQVLLYLPACRALTQAGAISACGALDAACTGLFAGKPAPTGWR